MFGGWELSALESVLDPWKQYENLAAYSRSLRVAIGVTAVGPVKPTQWSPAWVPFVASGGGGYLVLDLDAAPGGNRGQVVTFEPTGGERKVIAPSFASWLVRIADDFEAGKWVALNGGSLKRNRSRAG